MSYKRADEVLPMKLIKLIQRYVDGESIYIPRRTGERSPWGYLTDTREELERRNRLIFEEYLSGSRICELAEKYFLSEKSIQRIIREIKRKH